MAFSINTNISSLQAQYYLNQTSNFQSKTINQVTSGLRIVNSGDDAAGLAVANGLRSDEAVLNQGIRNLNDGLSTLQTIDGGMSNISNLLDRARTLATQSASTTFTGDRTTLNSEYQSVMGEINRQAQSAGVNVGGDFAKNLQVFIGGGRGATNSAVLSNGSVTADLSAATVDTQSLGLNGYQSTGATNAQISTLATAIAAAGGTPLATLTFQGNGYDSNSATNAPVSVSVSLKGVTDAASLVTAVNNGIAQAANSSAAGAAAFKNAGITASMVTNATTGVQALTFTAANGTFNVNAAGNTAGAGNGYTAGGFGAAILGAAYTLGGATATAATSIIGSGTYQSGTGAFTALGQTTVTVNNQAQDLTFQAADSTGTLQSLSITLSGGAGNSNTTVAGANFGEYDATTLANAVTSINKALQGSSSSALKNIVAYADTANNKVGFTSTTAFTTTLSAMYQDNLSGSGPGTLGAAAGFTGAATSTSAGAAGTTGIGTDNASAAIGTASSLDISTAAGAQAAITALGTATAKLGSAQAVIGKGENQFNYALNLASTQVTNLAATESRIRDADLAAQAANLSKAQIMTQAGVAALAQANSAPQAVLSLLKG